MKQIKWLVITLFLFSCTKYLPLPGPGPTSPPIDSPVVIVPDTNNFIVVWGESNSAGNAFNSQALASELLPRSGVQIFNEITNKFEDLWIGHNNQQFGRIDSTRHGPEIGIANQVDSGHLKNIYLVKIGASGTWVDYWMPAAHNYWDFYMPFVDSAVEHMKALGKPFKIIVWSSMCVNNYLHANGGTEAQVIGMYKTFIQNFRDRYNDSTILFLGADNNAPKELYYPFAWASGIDSMEITVPHFKAIDCYGMTFNPDLGHWDYAGQKYIAAQMAKFTK